jgi:hypothetical protein
MTSILSDLYQAVCSMSDPARQIARTAREVGHGVDALTEATLVSGALPGEFGVCIIYKPREPQRFVPALR